MKLSKKSKYTLFMLLILLNIILRFPLTPHEIGVDTFEIHVLANSLSAFGEARWWLHPLSVIGMYPNSYASSTPFLLSGISQCVGSDVEFAVFIYAFAFGLFSIFAAYIVAGEIYNSDLFKFLVAFGYSTAPGVLTYTTWTAPARSPFLILMPLFLYALLKTRKHPIKFGLITLIFAFLLLATHHLVFYLIPILAAFFLVTLVYKLKEHFGILKEIIERSETLMPFLIIFAFLLMAAFPFLTHKFMTQQSRWDLTVFKEYARYIGIFVFLAVGGLFSLVFKPNKRYEEWFLLTMLIFLTVFIFQSMYMKWFILLYAFLLAGISFLNFNKLHEKTETRKRAVFIIVIFLLLSVSFGGYFQLLYDYEQQPNFHERYMEDDTYITGLWLKENANGRGISNDRWTGWRISSVSGFPFLTGSSTDDQAYGFFDAREYELQKLPITSEKFWLDMPYQRISGTVSGNAWQRIMTNEYNSGSARDLLVKCNFTHLVENTMLDGKWVSHHGRGQSAFLRSLYISGEKEIIYDAGNSRVWYLK